MLISGDRLRLYYWDRSGKGYPRLCNLKEIEKEEYGYNLIPEQKVHAIRYEGTNWELYFDVVVKDINNNGILIETKGREVFCLWEKEFPKYDKNIICKLYVEPCEILYEENKLQDILSGNITTETVRKSGDDIQKGIWYKHGGWRKRSSYEKNLKNFVKLGQMTFV